MLSQLLHKVISSYKLAYSSLNKLENICMNTHYINNMERIKQPPIDLRLFKLYLLIRRRHMNTFSFSSPFRKVFFTSSRVAASQGSLLETTKT